MPLLGTHMPTAGGLHHAVINGRKIGCDAMQIFTRNPNQWQTPPLTDTEIEKYREALHSTRITFVASHDAYLINLASPKKDILRKSRKAFLEEVRRCDLLHIPFLVTHLGSHMGSGEEEGLKRLAESVHLTLEKSRGCSVRILLETTAGQGNGLGYRFEHLRFVIDRINQPDRLGVCLDTCHVFAAGYDLRDRKAYRKTMREYDSVIGLRHLYCIHMNDAKKPLGSRVDRHEHIGKGTIGLEAFRLFVNDANFTSTPILLETPESETMHKVNLNVLRRLLTKRRAQD